MENIGGLEQNSLIDELTLGRDFTNQLQMVLNSPSSSNSAREFLVKKILDSYEKSLLLLNSTGATGNSGSPHSFAGSPRSEDSDREVKDQDGCRKRKMMPRWTQQVRVTPGTGLGGPPEDGFNWRKYGQKDILGASYPRGYHRCTYRKNQGCMATKQVQRSDEDPTIFDISYRGKHTCHQFSDKNDIAPPLQSQNPQSPPINIVNANPNLPEDLLFNFQNSLTVMTSGLEIQNQPSFDFSSQTQDFDQLIFNDNFLENFSSANLISPANSASGDLYGFGVGNQYHDSGLTHRVDSRGSGPSTAAVTAPLMESEYRFGDVELGQNYTFGNHGFYS